jgi:hypothetical protein
MAAPRVLGIAPPWMAGMQQLQDANCCLPSTPRCARG